nr:glycoside hydrolase family 3 C-terminal domain-containing protein [Bacillus sp. HNG]
MAEEGSVLLKNDNGFLPLDGEPKSIALIGIETFAGAAKMSPRSVRDDNDYVVTPYTVTPQEGLENVIKELGYNTKVTYNNGSDPKAAAKLAAESDVVLLMVGDNPHETVDRETLGFPALNLKSGVAEQEPLIDAVMEANPENTVVVLKTSGTSIMPWLDKVPAVLQAWYPGMEDGNAVANLLYGKVNPSGKLPMTFGATEREAAFATEKQYPGTRQDTGKVGGPGPYGDGKSDQLIAQYTEGLEMGYRWYEANNVKPVFPFGYGLSYTTFEYGDLKVKKVRETGKGGKGALSGLDVSFTVTNTGDVAGKEAAQVYLTLPDEAGQPTKRLVNFEKVDLEPGESQRVTVRINHADSNHPFSYFVPEEPDNLANWADGEWATVDGKYRVHVGGSSADTPLEKDVPLNFKLDKENGKGNN